MQSAVRNCKGINSLIRSSLCCKLAEWILIVSGLVLTFSLSAVSAHDASNMNDANIDRTNDIVVTSIDQVQQLLSGLFMYGQTSTTWPDPEISRTRDTLLHLQEETTMGLDYLANNGINIQDTQVLRDKPHAGRSVAAKQAIDVAMNLLKHAESLESQNEFIAEIYNGGLSAYMYNLLGAHKDRLLLYKELMHSSD